VPDYQPDTDKYTDMRRSDRAITDDVWIQHFLQTAASGTLALADPDTAQPFVNTNLFVYDAQRHAIYLHTARTGRTRDLIVKNPRVCFSIMQMGRLLPADEALEFSVEYAGVTVFGQAQIVQDEDEATDALQALLDKYAPHLIAGDDYRPPVPPELKRTAVYRVDIDDWSGKRKSVEAFDGAFWYAAPPVLGSLQQRTAWRGTLKQIFIAPEGGQPVQSVETVEAVAKKGLRGDRYFGFHDEDEPTNLTLIAQEDIDAVQREYDIPLQPEQTRRNLITVGVPLSGLVGKTFRVGEAVLYGGLLCEPCHGIAESTGYGHRLIKAMVHRGGLRADVVKSGVIHPGDVIVPLD
jgi:hypothetical protein